jgi:hypothetical protein
MSDEERLLVAFDLNEMKPGCALVQTALGATHGIASRFDPAHWLLAPTPGMKVYPLTAAQVEKLAGFVATRHAPGYSAARIEHYPFGTIRVTAAAAPEFCMTGTLDEAWDAAWGLYDAGKVTHVEVYVNGMLREMRSLAELESEDEDDER